MKYLMLCALCVFFIGQPAVAANEMTHEEIVVRTAYAKLAYASKLGVVLRNAQAARVGRDSVLDNVTELEKQMDEQLSFQFQAINAGILTEIQDTRWDTLVTKPQLDLVLVEYVHFHEPKVIGDKPGGDEVSMNYVLANWQRIPNTTMRYDWNTPVKQIVSDLNKYERPGVVFTRYAMYTVTVKLAGRERTYQAIVLFGKNPDGSEAIYPIDHVLGMGALNIAIEKPFYPQPLLETYMREIPGMSAWIASATIVSDSPVQDVLCDATGKCGISSKVVERALAIPVDPKVREFYQHFVSDAADAITPDDTPTSCSGYNSTFPFTPVAFGTTDHSGVSTGNDHIVTDAFTGACFYTSGGTANCNTQCEVEPTGTAAANDQGKTVTGYCHVVGVAAQSGQSAATNGGASCAATMGGGADECPTSACDCTVSVSVAGLVSGSAKAIWTATVPVPLACNSVPDPNSTGGKGGIKCQGDGGGNGGCTTPIIVDTTGSGFHLTSAAEGVMFDFWGDGHPIKLSWTAAGSGNAFLALDRHRNGRLTGKDLFGNASGYPNGYLDLAQFDKKENGGNGDGIIDKRDAVFKDLLLWIDENHDGISQPNELHHLADLGVYSIALKYRDDRYVDKYGNGFRYRGVLNPDAADGKSKDGRYTYDVFLVQMPRKQPAKTVSQLAERDLK